MWVASQDPRSLGYGVNAWEGELWIEFLGKGMWGCGSDFLIDMVVQLVKNLRIRAVIKKSRSGPDMQSQSQSNVSFDACIQCVLSSVPQSCQCFRV